ncbi:MAG: 16S rRNA (cytosine(1402)-N(4))-methyltransferase RsmH [Planctomycetota bacterium]|jgi:16S rRNA (cytosine1402-N4)-methyltransferase
MEVNSSKVEHIPVLARTLVEQINLPRDGVMVDATIGQGGHSLLFGKTLGPDGVIIALDVDKKSIQGAQIRLKDLSCKVIFINANFSEISERVREQGFEKADFILADLGVCSGQLADSEIGLSFQTNMPLDMRIDQRIKSNAADIVNKADQKSLADLIYKFGQERGSRRIARFIVRERQSRPIATTGQLAAIVCRALGQPGRRRKSRIHPATRTFQALRIAVNKELENLERLLLSASGLLAKQGRIAVISFHSLEDRLVKSNFKANEKDGVYKIITKKPIVPSREEIGRNQRARSAKLRIAERL